MAKRRANGEGTIRKRNDGRWEAMITTGYDPISGKPKRESLYGKTQQAAREKATEVRHQLAHGTYVDPSRMTVGQWLEAWLETYYTMTSVRPLTRDTYMRIARRHLVPALGHLLLQELRPDHVERYLREKHAAGLAPSTIRQHRDVLSAALRQALKLGLVARNVCQFVDAPPVQRKDRQTLSIAQLRDQLLPTVQADRLAALYLTEFLTGLRRGELLDA